jgi:hypothetical protein
MKITVNAADAGGKDERSSACVDVGALLEEKSTGGRVVVVADSVQGCHVFRR